MTTEEAVEARVDARRRRSPRFRESRITMAHGSGGKASRALVEGLILPILTDAGGADEALLALGDAARLGAVDGPLAFTTDSFVVFPLRFPGGSIGEVAVNGTVNDLAVAGARPLALSVSLIIEEGLDADTLAAEVAAMGEAASLAGVRIVCGDTKVVERGKADGLYVITSGIGSVVGGARLAPDSVRPGDAVVVSGTVGDHGMAVMLARGELDLRARVESDTTSLWPVAESLMDRCGAALRTMRDATRGGVATVLNEIAMAAQVAVMVDEGQIPVREAVAGAGELLGIDPLYMANEGKLVAFVAADAVDEALAAMRVTTAGAEAAVIGQVAADPPGRVVGRTGFGGHRMIDMLVGDPLPRIC